METVSEILIDISGNMKLKTAALNQILLNDILPELFYIFKIGIKTKYSFYTSIYTYDLQFTKVVCVGKCRLPYFNNNFIL